MTPRIRKSLLRSLILVLALTLILSSAVYAAPPRAVVAPINGPAVSALAPGQTCGDKFEPNESYNGAVQFPVQTDQYATICTSTDEDWFKFSVVAGQRIESDLTQLPADYDLELYAPSDSTTPVQVSNLAFR